MMNKIIAVTILGLFVCMASSSSVTRLRGLMQTNQTADQIANKSSPSLDDTVARLMLASTAVDRLNILDKNSDYIFDFQNPTPGTAEISGKAGHIVGANRKSFPAVVGTGLSMNLAFVGPCGLNTPHTHPRASEIFYSINGTFEIGFIAENGARPVTNTIYGGQVTVFPQGSIHYQANLGCESAGFIAAFSNEDPGISLVAQNFFRVSGEVLSPVLGNITQSEIESIASSIPDDIALGLKSCRIRCGLEDSI